MPIIMLVSLWMGMGKGFLAQIAGFQSMPPELYEAGRVDGRRVVARVLAGDAGAPPDQRRTWTTWNPFRKDSPLRESGLLGPVRLMAAR